MNRAVIGFAAVAATLTLELRTKNGGTILSPPAPLMFEVELGATDTEPDPIALQQNVWQYPDTASAARAWAVLKKRALPCTGRSPMG